MSKPNKYPPIRILALSQDGHTSALKCYRHLSASLPHNLIKHNLDDSTDIKTALRHAYLSGKAIIAVGAPAILVRTLGSLCKDKGEDPPVLCLERDEKAVTILLGGKNGGESLAEHVASAFKAMVIGASPRLPPGNIPLLTSPLGEKQGWVWQPQMNDTALYSSLRAHAMDLDFDRELLALCLKPPFPYPQSKNNSATSTANPKTNTKTSPMTIPRTRVLCSIRNSHNRGHTHQLVPPICTLGLGCVRNATFEDLWQLILESLAHYDINPASIAAIGTITKKADEPAMHAVARQLNRPLRFFSTQQLNKQRERLLSPSAYVKAHMGTPSVAEASALSLSGAGGVLIVPKHRNRRATVALAMSDQTLCHDNLPGQALGEVNVLGIGPGSLKHMSLACIEHIEQCDMIFGYRSYIETISPLVPENRLRAYPIGAEKERVRDCLEYAAKGYKAGLVCSGDAGIFGLASLLCEEQYTHANPLVRALRVHFEAGISAMQAASARVGGILNHDFCVLSLSDLMTEKTSIMKRVRACAQADLVVAFYNPQSARRRDLLPYAIAQLKPYRPERCPVVVARHLDHGEESINVTTLKDFDTETVDMHTIVICGNSQSQILSHPHASLVMTPRGYHKVVSDHHKEETLS